MLRFGLFLVLLGTVLADDSFTKKYAYSKIMTSCVGEDAYYAYARELMKHSLACKKEIHEMMEHGEEPEVQVNEAPLASFFQTLRGSSGQPQYIPIPVYYQSSQAVNPFAQFQRQKREAMYSGELLKKMVKKVKAKVGTLMCVLKKFGSIDEDKNLNIALMKAETLKYTSGLDAALADDFVDLIDKCNEFSKCVQDGDSPLPIELQRIMVFLKCDKMGRVRTCMKADLKNYLSEFDLSGLPEYDGDEDDKVEKLLHVLWGADPGTDPLDLLA